MGQKSHPISLRLKLNRSWLSNWYATRQKYGNELVEDLKIRKLIQKRVMQRREYNRLEISEIKIRRFPGVMDLYIYVTRPGMLIGRKGADIEELKKAILREIKESKVTLNISINEVKQADLDASVLSQVVGKMIVGRKPYRRAMKQAVSRAMNSGALGVKILIAGRLGGVEMARREYVKEGCVPLHTFDSKIDFGHYDALTTYGIIGVSVWVYTGKCSKHAFAQEEMGATSVATVK